MNCDWIKAKVCEILMAGQTHIYDVMEQFDLSLARIVINTVVDLEQNSECICFIDSGIVAFTEQTYGVPSREKLQANIIKHILEAENKLYWSVHDGRRVESLKYQNAIFGVSNEQRLAKS